MDERLGVRFDRVRPAEWILLVGALALLVDLVAFPWYSVKHEFSTGLGYGHITTYDAGAVFHVLTPLAIVAILLAIVTWGAQATFRAPAIALCLTALSALLDLILAIGLLVRVVFDQPTQADLGVPDLNTIKPDVASVTGLVFAVIMLIGAWLSLRTDGIHEADAPARIETLRLAQRRS